MLRLVECLPEFSKELYLLAKDTGHTDIAEQVEALTIVDRCRCGDDVCATFYTAPRPVGSYGPTHQNIELPAKEGAIILDLFKGSIHSIEVLDREDVRLKLHAILL